MVVMHSSGHNLANNTAERERDFTHDETAFSHRRSLDWKINDRSLRSTSTSERWQSIDRDQRSPRRLPPLNPILISSDVPWMPQKSQGLESILMILFQFHLKFQLRDESQFKRWLKYQIKVITLTKRSPRIEQCGHLGASIVKSTSRTFLVA